MIDIIIGMVLLLLIMVTTLMLVILNKYKDDIWEVIRFNEFKEPRDRRKKRNEKKRKN